MKLEEIENKLEIANSEYDEVFENLPLDLSYSAFVKILDPYSKKIQKLSREKRLLMIPEFEDVPNYGDMMTLNEFIKNCKSGGFIDSDGYGNYIRDDKMSDINIYPSDIRENKYRTDFTHIVWFNK
jgi:hypothetical protein